MTPTARFASGRKKLNHPFGDAKLSGGDIIEGLARYWDIHLCGIRQALERIKAEGGASEKEMKEAEEKYGPFFLPDGKQYTDSAVRFVFDVERRYNRAYDFMIETVGREAFILFPIFGFFALSGQGMSVSHFQDGHTGRSGQLGLVQIMVPTQKSYQRFAVSD